MKNINDIGERLSLIASCVRDGVTLIDVGTDHAFLPVYLVLTGRIKNAAACDIAEGPLSKARQHIDEAGLSQKIGTVLSNGLEKINIPKRCDIVIAGMGGELISDIISAAKDRIGSDVRLILQPMTRPEHLRLFLSQNGFDIISERLSEEGKIYQVIVCRYTGENYTLSDAELSLGKKEAREASPLFCRLAEKKIMSLKTIAEGKRDGGVSCEYEERMISELTLLIEKENECN